MYQVFIPIAPRPMNLSKEINLAIKECAEQISFDWAATDCWEPADVKEIEDEILKHLWKYLLLADKLSDSLEQ